MEISRQYLTGKFRVSFPSLFTPSEYDGVLKYEVTALISKSDGQTMEEIEKAMAEAAKARWGDNIPEYRSPVKDGDQKFTTDGKPYAGYPGHWYIKMTSRRAPGVIDVHKQDILDSNDIYGGCYGRAIFQAGAYGGKGERYSPGVSIYLKHFQKLADGEPFGSKTSAKDDFPDLPADFGVDDLPF